MCRSSLGLTVYLAIILTPCIGQPVFSYPKINTEGKIISDFVPAGWEMVDSAADYYYFKNTYISHALVLQCKDNSIIELKYNGQIKKEKCKPRILVVLFQYRNTGVYRLVEQNNQFIVPENPEDNSDPFVSLIFKDDVLHINFEFNYGTSGNEELEYIFKFIGIHFVLIGAEINYYNKATLAYMESSYNFLSGKWSFSYDDGNKISRSYQTWHIIKYKGLRPLSAFREPHNWKFDGDQSL
jgi:hypothetical protein